MEYIVFVISINANEFENRRQPLDTVNDVPYTIITLRNENGWYRYPQESDSISRDFWSISHLKIR